jgi:dipeptidyl aminopeptidase/acylaminoacyl peptidase
MNKHTVHAMAVLFCLAVLAAVPIRAAANRLEPTDVFNLETANDPQISPDGSRVVYVRRFADIMTDKRYSNLWVIDVDGGNHRPLTTGNHNDASPRWSPDGSRLIYTSDREGTPQIFLRWMDTGQTARLTNLEQPPAGIAWSPDGRQIAFTSLVRGKDREIGKLPAAPEGAEWADPAMVIDRVVYRFNGPGYLKNGYSQIFVVPAEGGTPRQISSGNFHHGAFAFNRSAPVWTPDGASILISANRRPDFEYEPLDNEIYEFSVEDGTMKALTDRRGPDNEPAVSPDGQHIAYVGFNDAYQGYQITRLYVMNRDGSDPRVLSVDLDRSVERPRWAPDSSGVYFMYDDRGNTKLGFYTLRGKMKTLTGDLGSAASSYSAGNAFSVASNGRIAFTHTTPAIPGDIAVIGPGRAPRRVLTAVNDDLLGHKKLGRVEEMSFASSVDDRAIQGWIITPPDFDPARKYPLILEIHGGPFANYGDRFDIEKQIWAAMDYVVLYVNPRGSTSYGEEFGNLIHHAYPGDDFYDLNSAVDAAVVKGFIDTDNLFVTGGSGGGVLTCWMIGRSDRFRAAVTSFPVINWYSWVLTADIPSFGVKYWFPGLPWDHTEHYMERSLLSVVKDVKTPTMVLTGEEDYRTPMSESEQYYMALKLLGVEAVLVRVPGEPHGVRRHPSHHMTKMLLITSWFDEHRARRAD